MSLTDSQKWLVFVAFFSVLGLLFVLAPILSPFLTALLLAYMGDPLVDKLEEWGASRTFGVIFVFFIIVSICLIALFLLIPALVDQLDPLILLIPKTIQWAKLELFPYIDERFGLQLLHLDWIEISKSVDWSVTGNVAKTLVTQVTQSSLAVIAIFGNLILTPVVTFYLLRDWDILVAKASRLIPRYYIDSVIEIVNECNETLSAFFRGQLLVMLCLSAIYALGLIVIGLDLGLLIGLLAGFASIVPYLGAIIGISAGLLAAFFQFGDVLHLFFVVLVFSFGQLLEGTVLTPKLVGNRIGLHPVAVIFSVLAGGQLFGFVGILLALPAAAIIMVLLRRLHISYQKSTLYQTDLPATKFENSEFSSDLRPQSGLANDDVDGVVIQKPEKP